MLRERRTIIPLCRFASIFNCRLDNWFRFILKKFMSTICECILLGKFASKLFFVKNLVVIITELFDAIYLKVLII